MGFFKIDKQFFVGLVDRIRDIITHIDDNPRMIGSSPMPNIKDIALGKYGIRAEQRTHQDK
jgi:hypothetical protein